MSRRGISGSGSPPLGRYPLVHEILQQLEHRVVLVPLEQKCNDILGIIHLFAAEINEGQTELNKRIIRSKICGHQERALGSFQLTSQKCVVSIEGISLQPLRAHQLLNSHGLLFERTTGRAAHASENRCRLPWLVQEEQVAERDYAFCHP